MPPSSPLTSESNAQRLIDTVHWAIEFPGRLVSSKEHSRAWYRIGATRMFSGSKKTKPILNKKLKQVIKLFPLGMVFYLVNKTITELSQIEQLMNEAQKEEIPLKCELLSILNVSINKSIVPAFEMHVYTKTRVNGRNKKLIHELNVLTEALWISSYSSNHPRR